jgi:hypothetical protein
MSPRPLVAAALAVLAASAVLAGCGGGAPSKASYLAKADPVCKQAEAPLAVAATPSDITAVGTFSAQVAKASSASADGLAKLKTPSGKDGQAAKAMVKALRDSAAADRAVADPVGKADYPGIEKAAGAAVEAAKAADDKARAFGSTQCGRAAHDAMDRLGPAVGPTARDAYVAKLDALCKTARDQVLAIPQPKSESDAVGYLAKTIPIGIKLVNDAKAVVPPAFDKDKRDDAFAAWDDVVAKSQTVQAAFNAGQTQKGVDLAQDVVQASVAFTGKAAAYGFKVCGQT